MKAKTRWRAPGTALAVALLAAASIASPAQAQANLQPVLPDLSDVVKDEDWARVLGKALFWDQLAGSDGMACASCHFHAGADSRIKNQLSPGLNNVPDADTSFGAIIGDLGTTRSGAVAGPNYEVVPEDFPFHHIADDTDRNSAIIGTTNDRMTSSGAYDSQFTDMRRGNDGESCGDPSTDVFHVNGLATRQNEPRNTPTTVNAVFFARLFWDGRANNVFNGKGVFGWRDIDADPTARVLVHKGDDVVDLEVMAIENAALASQAVGPPLSATEMSCADRRFLDIGRKILSAANRPLEFQAIHEQDSLLGAPGPFGDLRHPSGNGLLDHYKDLIKKAFHDKYWAGPGNFVVTADGKLTRGKGGYSQMEHNFSMFWGISIMLYEATLVSDQSKFDRANEELGGCLDDFPVPCSAAASTILTEKEADGHFLFNAGGFIPSPVGGGCTACHAGPLFSFAASPATGFIPVGNVIGVLQSDPTPGVPGGASCTIHDFGFFNIGSRPAHEDVGTGGIDPYGNPLSFAAQYRSWLAAGKPEDTRNDYLVDRIDVNPAGFIPPCNVEPAADARLKVDGSFKTPGLRNVALTPPYFHYGGYATLEQVVEFYARGGNRRDKSLEDLGFTGDDSGTGPTGDSDIPVAGPHFGRNTDDGVRPLNLALGGDKDQQYGIEAIADFMRTLTDERLQCDQAPFDHPSLPIFHGHAETDSDGDGKADDIVFVLPAVGADGYQASHPELCIPNAGDLFAPGMLARVGR